MIIRKLYKFENAHIVRDCSSRRCSKSIHGHSYKVEIKLSSNYLDDGQMVYDFGLMKTTIKDIIDSFDHAITLWEKDDKEYIEYAKKFSERYVILPLNPSAEQFSRIFFIIIDKLLSLTNMKNGEKEVKLHSVITHETETGYAECFYDDAYNFKNMGKIDLSEIIFSDRIKEEWKDTQMWDKILKEESFNNPTSV
jgi:6-pyruvoyltetrahydropterin/6-carboxytetrahydropterin synthase